MSQKICKSCSKLFVPYNSLTSKCPACQAEEYRQKREFRHKVQTKLDPLGPIARKWIATRKEWINSNPEPWACHYCGVQLARQTLTLDHLQSRSRSPHLRFEQSNLMPACFNCNREKGSLSEAEFRQKRLA